MANKLRWLAREAAEAWRNLGGRDRSIVRALGAILVANWAVAGSKIAVGAASGRLTIIADGLHGLLDGANNVLGSAAIIAAAQPPDEDHPYGHRKFENVAAMCIGGLIALVAWEVLDNVARTVWRRLASGEPPPAIPSGEPADALFMGILIASLAVNWTVATVERRLGERLNSPLLTADASHTLSDCWVTGLSLASLLAGGWAWWVDSVLALGVLAFLARASWNIAKENLPAFTDRARLDPSEVARVAVGVPGVLDAGEARSRGASSEIHLDLRIEVRAGLSAAEAEAIESEVGDALREAFPDLAFVGIRHVARHDDA